MAIFSVGEIAIFQNARVEPAHNGQECEVVQPLGDYVMRPHEWYPQGRPYTGYVIRFQGDNDVYAAAPDQLRKRRPPQDWVKLCNLDKIPEEVTA